MITAIAHYTAAAGEFARTERDESRAAFAERFDNHSRRQLPCTD
jgi:hypothetical protein